MDEVKHNRFVKVAEKRMEVLINDFYKMGESKLRQALIITQFCL